MKYITTQGNKFTIYELDNEIVYCDDNNDILTWDNTKENWLLVNSMIEQLTNVKLLKKVA